jgi:L-lactate dehydrogenase complex protein LldE
VLGLKVSLFITCLADHFYPEVGEAVVHLLRRYGCEVDFPSGQTCCGQPAWNTGLQDDARAFARNYMDVFDKSEYIVMPSGSCAGHVRYFYPQMFKDDKDMFKRASAIADRTFEFSEFLVKVLGVKDVGATYKAKAVYHNNCHMNRELGVREEPLELLRNVRGLELVENPRPDLCCGFGGAFSVKMPEISTAMADEKLGTFSGTGADLIISADGGCLMHMGGRAQRQGLKLRTIHLAQLLWEGVQNHGR